MDTQINGNLIEEAPYRRLQKERIQTNENLVKLEQLYNVSLEQINGQRILRHADNSVPTPTEENCEVFVGKLPRDILEDDLYPLFAKAGEIYEARLMMDFSGSNRGFGFIKYKTETDARNAIRMLNRFEIKPGHMIGVIMSLNNSKLNIGNLPFDIEVKEIIKEFINIKKEIKKVSVYKDLTRRYRYAIITYQTHRDAAMARREFAPRKVNLFGKGVSVDWADPDFRAENVIEEAAEIKENGDIVIEQPVMLESKKNSRNGNQNHKPLKFAQRCKFDNKSKSSEVFIQNKTQRHAIREQKLTEMSKKKVHQNQKNRKKNHKAQASNSDSLSDKFSSLKTDLNSNFDYSRDRYDSCIDSSCKSSLISDTASEPATPTANFSLFEEFTFSRPSMNTRSYQDSYQYNDRSPVDDLCSNFENCMCFDMKKYDEVGGPPYQPEYVQVPAYDIDQNLQYELNHPQSTSNYYQHFRDYNDHQLSPIMYANGNSVFQLSQVQEDVHQPAAATFAPRLNNYSCMEKRCASPVCYKPSYNEIYTPTYFKPLTINCQSYNQTAYIGKTNLSSDVYKSDTSYQKNGTCAYKHIPSVRSVGLSNRRNQVSGSTNWNTRIIQNVSGHIPAGARPILRRHD